MFPRMRLIYFLVYSCTVADWNSMGRVITQTRGRSNTGYSYGILVRINVILLVGTLQIIPKKQKKNKLTTSLLEKCPCSELFWSSFSSIRTRITPNKDTFYAVLFVRLFFYSHKNNIKMFRYYSHNILIRLLR